MILSFASTDELTLRAHIENPTESDQSRYIKTVKSKVTHSMDTAVE